ncbi:hypothetical protein IU433_24030 [Nocardia puris]|uniref:Uncharacterized protein n=1 Tax=Nocardia puris TaxID=208602 RepID=A0A366DJH0_9NOCA|nr:hypothetical protein [Nocardia puris]MBF6213205.1 hypothetical protein [Nocardia puris]MBF6370124.1 hypothetical protein [Nocardia puris]MBF6462084.1 hypothetical protein [Nocardia puris]RBO89388.1 hypothetical protein DFR74_10765 [Nocardia puris]
MYPSQTVAHDGRRAAGPGTTLGQHPRVGGPAPIGPQGLGTHNAIASFVTYAKALESLDRNHFPDEYAINSDRIRELEPFLRAHGILDVMQIKNPEVAALVAHS